MINFFRLLKKRPRVVCLFPLLFLFTAVNAQTVMVSGVVKDDKGQLLSGVTIKVKGASIMTMSDENGKFHVSAPGTAIALVFSYLRLPNKEVVTASDNNLQVVIPVGDNKMDEVVVVGYGTQKKASLLGAISTVGAADIMRGAGTNLSQAIVGKLPGLVTRQESGLPGSDQVDIYVRGFGSLNSNTPLVLVDGVERDISSLDPSEVESVTILKDAASAAVYGVRGANGVILVTTKRGKTSKPTFSYTGSYTISQSTRLPQYLNGEEFVKWYNYADEINGRSHTFPDAVVNKVTKGDPDGIYGNTNWEKRMLKSAPTMQHNISLRGGDQSIKYFMSLGYLDQLGIISGVDYSRYNLRLNVDANVTNDFSIGLNLSGNLGNANSPQISNFTGNGNSVTTNLMNQIITAHPYLNARTPDGQYLSSALEPGNNPQAARDLSGYNDNDNTGLQNSLTLQYKLPHVRGLSFKTVASYDRNFYHTKSFYTPYTLATADPTQSSPSLYQTASPYGTIAQLSESYTQSNRWTLQEYVNYDRSFGKHTVGALIVAEQSGYHYTGLGASAQNFDLTDLSEFSFAKDNPVKPTGSSSTTNRVGWVGRFNYVYDNRYLFEFSGREDASTNFPKSNRYGFFPSFSTGWHVSEEKFFKDWETSISNLKLTASYGILGNDATGGAYQYLQYFNLSTSPVANLGGSNVNGLLPTSYPNTNLTWEKSKTANLGLQVEWWKGLLSAEFNGFYKLTTNILTTVSSTYPPSLGGYYPTTVNSGKVDNRGFELVLGHKNKLGQFSYSLTGSLSWSHNRILNMDQSADIPEYLSLIGHPMGAKTGLIAQGLFKTDAQAAESPNVSSTARAGDIRYKDINGDGKITYDQDVTIIGRSSYPELNYSLNYASSWKQFELSFLIQGTAICDNALMGYYDGIGWDDTQFTRDFYNGGNTPKYLVEGSWSPANPSGKYPRLDNQWRANNNWASSMWIVNGAYLRLKNVQLAYNIHRSGHGSPFDAQIYLASMNLLTFSAFKYLDPEAPNVNNGYYPQQKTYSLGARITF
ncbi:MAG: TonB-dependent receptor [Puia sp.]|nr:TonB-dependent receptor [Puia sp.]